MSRIIKAAQLKVLVPGSDDQVFTSDDPSAPDLPKTELDHIEGTILEASGLLEQAKKEAALIVADAQNQAADFVSQAEQTLAAAEAQAAHLKEEAQREGYTSGYTEGQDLAFQEFQTKVEDLLTVLENVITGAEQKRLQALEQSEEDFLKLSLHIAEKIIKREIKNDPEWLRPIIREGLKQLSNVDQITIRLHDSDFEVINSWASSFTDIYKGKIRWVTDSRLDPGDCMIETEYGAIDASLDHRLQKITAALKEGMYIDK